VISVWQRLHLAAHRHTPAGRLGPTGVPFIVASDRHALLGSRRLRGVELPVALLDAASPLVPGNRGADMVRASPFARGGNFLLRLAGCQGKDLIAQAR
jgi:hypothetical protein